MPLWASTRAAKVLAQPRQVRCAIHRGQDHAFLQAKEGQLYLRDGDKRKWLNNDLQSFTPAAFHAARADGLPGRAIVIDPDVFAVGDAWELLSRDMADKALMCRPKSGNKGKRGALASSVMLLDCARLKHWKTEEQFNEDVRVQTRLHALVGLYLEDRSQIGLFDNQWNDFDHLDENTKMLHTTKRWHQPWKTGLPIDFRPPIPSGCSRPSTGCAGRVGPFSGLLPDRKYKGPPDPAQERFFFQLVSECLDTGIISEKDVRDEMAHNHVRHDALELVKQLAA